MRKCKIKIERDGYQDVFTIETKMADESVNQIINAIYEILNAEILSTKEEA